MKKLSLALITVLIACFGLSSPVMAEHDKSSFFDEPAREGAKVCSKKLARMAKKLDLSEEQQAQFLEIMETQKNRKHEIIEASGVRESLKNLRLETKDKLGAVLTEDQLEKFEHHHDRHRSHKRKGHGDCDHQCKHDCDHKSKEKCRHHEGGKKCDHD